MCARRQTGEMSLETDLIPGLRDLFWVRTDVPGSEVVAVDENAVDEHTVSDRTADELGVVEHVELVEHVGHVEHVERVGHRMRGSQHAIDPVPYALTYELWTDTSWATTRLIAHTEGAGWTRDLELLRSGDGWVWEVDAVGNPGLASFDGSGIRDPAPPGAHNLTSIHSAIDIDIGGSPLTNSLPVQRLGLLSAERGHVTELVSAWVLPPTLEVVASAQTYTALGGHRIRYGDFVAGVDVEYGSDGWVSVYPGLARRAMGSA